MTRRLPGPPYAFTLLELLIVVGIIAILAAIALPNLLAAQVRAKTARVKADMRTAATAFEAYAVDNNRYPPDYDSGIYPDITPGNDEYLSFAALTTPVAYLTAAPRDIFTPRPDGRPDFYEYYEEEPVRIRNSSNWGPTWFNRGIKYYMYSFGPDRTNNQLAEDQDLAILRAYDPTNGIVSFGDLGRSNIGPSH